MKLSVNAKTAIEQAKTDLWFYGTLIEQKTWQSVKSPDKTWDLCDYSLKFPVPDFDNLVEQVKPNLPWADEHFEERVSEYPHNPPPSHVRWPFAQKNNEQFTTDTKFSHTYPERFWPARELDEAGVLIKYREGIRFNYADLNTLIGVLAKDETTRQAYLPIWFPEDGTAAEAGERVPCTLGYLFRQVKGFLHMTYYIRSCDIIRHFRDDIYLAIKLQYYVLRSLSQIKAWKTVVPGYFTMHIGSLHCFESEKGLLKLSKT